MDDIKALLTQETNVYTNSLPDTPDNAVLLTAYASQKTDVTFERQTIEYPGVHVLVRDTSFASAYSRAESIKSILKTVITPISPVLPAGQDEKKRSMATINFEIIIT